MSYPDLESATRDINQMQLTQRLGRVQAISGQAVEVSGLADMAEVGGEVEIQSASLFLRASVLSISGNLIRVLPRSDPNGIRLNAPVFYRGRFTISPHATWLGRIIGAAGEAIDGKPLRSGTTSCEIKSPSLPAAGRGGLGQRLASGSAVFDSLLPIVEGQRIGLFSGSGVGKSTLLAQLATKLETDVAIVALIGERGREVMEFAQQKLSEQGRSRTIIVAATSDKSAADKCRAAEIAMTLAEWFRDQGKSVLFVCDSVTRFAEAHRDIATISGEVAGPSGYPPSTSAAIMALVERAGPGAAGTPGITAVFSVLAEGSDMDGYVPDVVRGVLDGHVILEREIAEQGRFPAINLRRSVSRALPNAASPAENATLLRIRKLAADYDNAALMIKSGLYDAGANRDIDRAITAHPLLEDFLSSANDAGFAEVFQSLEQILAAVENPT